MPSCRPLRGMYLPLSMIGRWLLAIVALGTVGPSILLAAEEERTPQKWALLIGIDEYESFPSLTLVGADQREVAAQLTKVGFAANHVFVMHDKARKGSLPSKANIERQLKLLLDPTKGLVEKGDTVLVSFSGYGVSRRGHSYLCPSKATDEDPAGSMIPLETIYQQFSRSRAALKLLVVDVCRADPSQSFAVNPMSRGFANSLRKPPRGLLVLTSCSLGQVSVTDQTLKHGVFTRYLLDGLKGRAARTDGVITAMGLYYYVSALTRKYTTKKFKTFQNPVLEGKMEGRFELGQIPRQPPPETAAAPAETPSAEPAAGQSAAPPAEVKKAPPIDAKLIANSIGMKLALIPPGEFLMGSPDAENGHGVPEDPNEKQHQVRITRPFYLGLYEVTQSQYQSIMGNNPSGFSSIGKMKDKIKGYNTSVFPVEQVSLEEALEFCRRLSEFEGRHYRLPTEAEWEYACRAGTNTTFSFGDTCNGSEANCNGDKPYGVKTKGPQLGRPSRVGSFRPNAFGLYDMHGNVWERCSDLYARDYYLESPPEDPTGSSDGGYRVSRGGSWLNEPIGCRSANRYGFVPSWRDFDIGFRACLDVEVEPQPDPTAAASQ